MNQYNTKKGIQKFSDQGSATVEKEVRQLLTMGAIKLGEPTDITNNNGLDDDDATRFINPNGVNHHGPTA